MTLPDLRPSSTQTLGLVGAGVVGALIAVLVNASYRGGADAGDWLQFFGGMLGAALAVVGAVYFEGRRSALQRHDNLSALADVYDELATYLDDLTPVQPLAGADELSSQVKFKASISHFNDRLDASYQYLQLFPLSHIRKLDDLRLIMWSKDQLTTVSGYCDKFIVVNHDGFDLEKIEADYLSTLKLRQSISPNTRAVAAMLRRRAGSRSRD